MAPEGWSAVVGIRAVIPQEEGIAYERVLHARPRVKATGIKMAAAAYDGRKLPDRWIHIQSPTSQRVKDGQEFAGWTGIQSQEIIRRGRVGWLENPYVLHILELIPRETDTGFRTPRETDR